MSYKNCSFISDLWSWLYTRDVYKRQMRNFVLQQIGQNEQMEKHLEELRKVCREQELKIEQLEKMLSEEKE